MSLPKFKFYHHKTDYNQAVTDATIADRDICVIEDTREIITKGVNIAGDISKEEVDSIINALTGSTLKLGTFSTSTSTTESLLTPTGTDSVSVALGKLTKAIARINDACGLNSSYQFKPADTSLGSNITTAINTLNNNKVDKSEFEEMLLDKLSYGVEWTSNTSNPTCTRIGNMTYHKTLPIQSGMKGCIYNPKEKKVVYWLSPYDWSSRLEDILLIGAGQQQGNWNYIDIPNSYYDYIGKYSRINIDDGTCYGTITAKTAKGSDGLFSVTVEWDDFDYVDQYLSEEGDNITYHLGSNLAGYDGEVMVYIPEFWIKSGITNSKKWVRIANQKIDETWEHQPAVFIGAFKDTILNTVPSDMGYLSTLEVSAAICVANPESYCRGGNGNASYDSEAMYKSQLGKPKTAISRYDMRLFERLTNKEILSYKQYKNLYWLWVIEYATFNSQLAYRATLTSSGYHQGGLGPGITGINNYGAVSDWNPVCPNGYTNSIGNNTGVKDINVPKLTSGSTTVVAQTLPANRWRGLENFFGDTCTVLDGIIIDALAADGYDRIYITDDSTKYSDSDITEMTLLGLTPHSNGFIKDWDIYFTAEILPSNQATNLSPSQYKCDYHWVSSKDSIKRLLIMGGDADDETSAGIGSFHTTPATDATAWSYAYRSACLA